MFSGYMKRYVFHVVIVLSVFALGAIVLRDQREGGAVSFENAAEPIPVPDVAEKRKPHAVAPKLPELQTHPAPQKAVVRQVAARPNPTKQPPKKALSEQQRIRQYWQQAEDRFNRQWDRLAQERDPSMRARLINAMARYIRMDTLSTVEWAMSLEDPEECRLALEAINKYALTGIGAKIGVDETGFPFIRETTVLSAVESTGMVAAGDYIIGLQDESGRYVDFEGLPVQQIVKHLRGEAGTGILLYMERAEGGNAYVYEVPVTRSLLVVLPPE